eukprot:jgi/Ulvmu1/7763/UM039_0071.1
MSFMASDQAGQCTAECKMNAATTTSGTAEVAKSGPGHVLDQDRDAAPSQLKRSWKDPEPAISASRRTFTAARCKPADGVQVSLNKQSTSTSSASQSTSITINDLPSDSIALILRKTLHPHYPGAIWGKNLYSAVHEARWFLMDGRNQSHRVLDKFPHDACIASVQTCHAMRSSLVCKRWNRIMKGEEGPGVVEHVAICGPRMASHLPRTVKTLLVHGQKEDKLWRLASDNGLAQLEAILTMRSRRSGSFAYKLANSCPALRHVGIASPHDGCERLSRRDLMYLGRLRNLSALELVDCDVDGPSGLQPLCSGVAAAAAAAAPAAPPAAHLRRLTLRCCGVQGAALAALAPLAPTLQMLVLEGVAFTTAAAEAGAAATPDLAAAGLHAIARLTDLRSLTLTSCDGVDRGGLEALTALQRLQYLDMADVWELGGDSLQPLASLTTLKVLALTDCESLQSSHLAALRWLSALQSLDLSRCARLDSFALRHVAALSSLTSLSLQGCESVDSRAMRHLRDLRGLRRLNLTGCRGIQTASLRHLRPLAQLEMLSLADLCRIGDPGLKFLRALPALRTLYVAGCPHITEAGLRIFVGHPAHVFT